MSKPSYLSLRFFALRVATTSPRSDELTRIVQEGPVLLFEEAFQKLLARFKSDEICEFVLNMGRILDDPESFNFKKTEGFDAAEERFLGVLLNQTMDMPLLLNNMGKAAVDLGLKPPFLF